jgi:alkaline phosphatase
VRLRNSVHKYLRLLALVLVLGSGCEVIAQGADCHSRNVILIIGDGMGLAQMSFLAYSTDRPVAVEQFPVVGLQKTHSASHLITDSGASATAIACGLKTYNNAIGTSADSLPCHTLLELAKAQGKATGIVVTSSIVHATPAAFFAHQSLRGFHEAIAENLLHIGVDYVVGGGQMYFTNRFSDDRNLVEEMRKMGYTVSGYDKKSFNAFSKRSDSKMAYFTAYSEPLPRMQGREDLSPVVTHALRTLTAHGDEGFFLMIEGSQVDFACHAQNAGYLLSEMKDLNGAIHTAYEYASRRDDTLVIVTGDHECGGLAIRESRPDRRVRVEFTARGHTAQLVPVYAYGPCAEMFSGLYENTEIFDKISAACGY